MSMHHGSCHCGAVQFDADIDLDNLATCNCSLCGRGGALMAFLPAEKVQNVVGRESMTDYQFGKKHLHHAFCATCGVRPIAWGPGEDGRDWMMVNARCIEGVDVHTLKVAKQYDGRSL